MEFLLHPISIIAWIINLIILFFILFISFLVFRDARKNKLSMPSSLLWTAVSLVIFPIGPLIYLFIGRDKL